MDASYISSRRSSELLRTKALFVRISPTAIFNLLGLQPDHNFDVAGYKPEDLWRDLSQDYVVCFPFPFRSH